jgi:GntR family histidine utilization transcriptional repressor
VINLLTVPEARGADFSTIAPGTWLLKQVPWSEARTTIGAVQAGKAVGASLDIDPHAACLRVDRTTWRDGGIVTVVEQLFDGAHYYLVARFRP